jgi:hypothetical protein
MNFIKQLQSDNADKDQEIKDLRDAIGELRMYMLSDKFNSNCELNGYVNIKDILLRLEGTK